MAKPQIGTRLSLVLDNDTRAEIERTMAETGEKSSAALLRKAITAGLPLVRSGATADVLRLDEELNEDVATEARRQRRNRQWLLGDAIRIGLPAVVSRWDIQHPEGGSELPPEQAALYHHYDNESLPLAQDYRRAFMQLLWLQGFVNDMRELPEGEVAYATVQTVREHCRAKGTPVPVSNPPGRMPRETILRLYAEAKIAAGVPVAAGDQTPKAKRKK